MTVSFAPRVTSRWSPAAGARARGTVVVLPGRGEHGEIYERLGRRLAFDGYQVLAIDALPGTPLSELVDILRSLELPTRPLVLLGADTGALEALQTAMLAGDLVDAVVAAALPAGAPLDWPDGPSRGNGPFAGPVLVLHGSADRRTSPEHAASIAASFPHGQLLVV